MARRTRTSPRATTAWSSARAPAISRRARLRHRRERAAATSAATAITPGGLTNGNYAITYAPGTLTVDPAPLTVTANDASRTYGAANPDFAASFDGFVLGEDAGALGGALDFATDADRASPVGRYTVTPGGLTSGNYAISYAPGTLTVDPAPLTVTTTDASQTYGSANPDFAATVDGFVLGEGLGELGGDLTFTTDANRRSDVGEYAVTPGGLDRRRQLRHRLRRRRPHREPRAANRHRQRRLAQLRRRATPTSPPATTASCSARTPPILDGALRFDTPATRRSDVGSYRVTPERADQRQLRHQLRPRHPDRRPRPADRDHQRRDAAPTAPPTPTSAPASTASCSARARTTSTARSTFDTAATRRSDVGTLRRHRQRPHQRQLRHQLRPRHPDRRPRPADRDRQRRLAHLRRRQPGLQRALRRLRARRGPGDLGGALDFTTEPPAAATSAATASPPAA